MQFSVIIILQFIGCLLITGEKHLHGRINDFISTILILYENVGIKLSAEDAFLY